MPLAKLTLKRAPAGSGPCDVGQGPAKTALTILHKECFHLIRLKSAINAHTTKPKENYRLANNLTNSVRKSPENSVRHRTLFNFNGSSIAKTIRSHPSYDVSNM